MEYQLKKFQSDAVLRLYEAMQQPGRNIVLKSPTGSGKTLILTHFMEMYGRAHPEVVFVWLTPGAGGLEEQSKSKMDRYVRDAHTKLLDDVMTEGFAGGDACFINWEKLTKTGNNALKESEHTNFVEHVEMAMAQGLRFVVLVDESHHNNTIKADALLSLFHTEKIIRCSATPRLTEEATMIEVDERDVILSGLIKSLLVINEDFPPHIHADSQIAYLLTRALDKQRQLRRAYLSRGLEINPLILIQLPNKAEYMQQDVEGFLEKQDITRINNRLAIWLSNQHENLEAIERNDAEPVALIMKQAVATGWDCPRAQILVKLRSNMEDVFEMQTIGRIRRMPEGRHYASDLLDSCYLYTFDTKFTQGVRQQLSRLAVDACTLTLKPEYQTVELTSEQKQQISVGRDPQQMLKVIRLYFEKAAGVGSNMKENQKRLELSGFTFRTDVTWSFSSGEIRLLERIDSQKLNQVEADERISTHLHGREYHHQVARFGLDLGIPYQTMNTILGRLFSSRVPSPLKILPLEVKELYAFVINNAALLRQYLREAMAVQLDQLQLQAADISKVAFHIPQTTVFTYSSTAMAQMVMEKSVYEGYLASANPRSTGECRFEEYCNDKHHTSIRWFYKNGDKGSEYFSIVYQDNAGYQRCFFPDYLIGVDAGNGETETWIIEIKGGFTRQGGSEDADSYSPKKFAELKRYCQEYNMKAGWVREDKDSTRLLINTDSYSEDPHKGWQLLSEVLP